MFRLLADDKRSDIATVQLFACPTTVKHADLHVYGVHVAEHNGGGAAETLA